MKDLPLIAIDNAIDNVYGSPEQALECLVNRETAEQNGEGQVWDRANDRALDNHVKACWDADFKR